VDLPATVPEGRLKVPVGDSQWPPVEDSRAH